MPLAASLATFQASTAQCGTLILNAHRADSAGNFIFPPLDRQQITVAAFLNLFIAWEAFLEDVILNLMVGATTISGTQPTRYVTPPSIQSAREMIIGTQRFFDYGNHDFVKKVVNIYFANGYPFEPHLSAIAVDLNDIRTMRNSSAHITSTTQTALESLAQRIFAIPRPGIDLYTLLTSPLPNSANGGTVFVDKQNRLLTAALLIANG